MKPKVFVARTLVVESATKGKTEHYIYIILLDSSHLYIIDMLTLYYSQGLAFNSAIMLSCKMVRQLISKPEF